MLDPYLPVGLLVALHLLLPVAILQPRSHYCSPLPCLSSQMVERYAVGILSWCGNSFIPHVLAPPIGCLPTCLPEAGRGGGGVLKLATYSLNALLQGLMLATASTVSMALSRTLTGKQGSAYH